jgi:hypothetical protein
MFLARETPEVHDNRFTIALKLAAILQAFAYVGITSNST